MPETGFENDSRDRPQPAPPDDRGRKRGIGSAAAGSLSSLLDYAEARLRLFLLEARETRGALVRRLIAVAAGAFFLVMAYATLLTGGIGWVSARFEWPWPIVTLAAGGGHLAIAAVLLLVAKARMRRPAFRDSLSELKKDRDWLRDLGSRK